MKSPTCQGVLPPPIKIKMFEQEHQHCLPAEPTLAKQQQKEKKKEREREREPS